MAETCNLTQIKYAGNGVNTRFTFPFTYMHFYDVKAALWDESKREYIEQTNKFILSDASTVQFLTPPPLPPASAPFDLNVLIYRDTDLVDAEATFFPGSSIRAQDLNDDFDQLRFAIQEVECGLENEREDTTAKVWNRESIKGRDDGAEPQPPYDTVYQNDQISGRWYDQPAEQEAIATTGAISERLDPFVQGSLPVTPQEGYSHQEGKTWINTDDCWQAWWDVDADAWVAFLNTGPRGAQGAQGQQGEPGPVGPPLQIVGVIPAGEWTPPEPVEEGVIYIAGGTITGFPGGGTPVESDALIYNGTNWINIGPLGVQGKKGDKGETGAVGPVGPIGPEGQQGEEGPIGETGNPGTGINFRGQVATRADLPSDAVANDGWQTLDTMDMWVWNGAVWINAGTVSTGPAGPQGPMFDIATLPPLPIL